ncbi:hypothetical protein [Bacillus sp. REN10]|uniref:hypothetical protein n=1 Tax=Bacillus sp. REN10 TaxID=2782541 RepID=UPI00193B9991|nr:hypothetical protein [Bacillus sp. REN10]
MKANHKLGEEDIPANPKRIVDLSGSAKELMIMGLTPVAHSNTYKEKTFFH